MNAENKEISNSSFLQNILKGYSTIQVEIIIRIIVKHPKYKHHNARKITRIQ